MDSRIRFTQEELQLLYAACMSYGDKLSEIKKNIPNENEIILDGLTDRAKDSWSPLSSNLISLIGEAIDDCFETGYGKSSNKEDIEVIAEWIDSKREGYSVIHLTILENGVVRFFYDDYGTEVAN